MQARKKFHITELSGNETRYAATALRGRPLRGLVVAFEEG